MEALEAAAALDLQEKNLWYPLGGRLTRHQDQSGHRGHKKNPFPLLGMNSCHLVCSQTHY